MYKYELGGEREFSKSNQKTPIFIFSLVPTFDVRKPMFSGAFVLKVIIMNIWIFSF